MTLLRPRTFEILLVEDNPGDVRLAVEAWRDGALPVQVNAVRNGEEGLAFLRRDGAPLPDLVLLDLNLPRMDGREMLAVIKRDPALRRIPVVVLTSSNAEDDLFQCYDLHANCYIIKPVALDALFRVLQSVRDFWLGMARLPTS